MNIRKHSYVKYNFLKNVKYLFFDYMHMQKNISHGMFEFRIFKDYFQHITHAKIIFRNYI